MSNTNHDTNQNLPPRTSATDPEQQVCYAAAGAVAGIAIPLWDNYPVGPDGTTTPEGKLWMEFEVDTAPAYIRFARDTTGGADGNTGVLVSLGKPRRFYLDPSKDLYVDAYGPDGCTLKWRKVGAICERSRQ